MKHTMPGKQNRNSGILDSGNHLCKRRASKYRGGASKYRGGHLLAGDKRLQVPVSLETFCV